MIKVLFATGNETKAKRFSKGLQEKEMLQEDESDVVEFIANSVNN